MQPSKRKVSFVLASTHHGSLIMSWLDFQPGIPNQFFEQGFYEPLEVSRLLELLKLRRHHYGDGVFAIDCGAHVGVHTVEWSKLMAGWGYVLAIEAQQRLYYALAGNIALNNCFNAQAVWAAVGKADGVLVVPQLDFCQPARFGSLELKQRTTTENIGQPVSYDRNLTQVPAMRLDSQSLSRVDLIKLDIEGMEIEALEGASDMIAKHRPLLVVEIIKSDRATIETFVRSRGYLVLPLGQLDIVAVHQEDKALPAIRTLGWSKDAA
jgi:FkbM family methyltransferase